MELAAGAILLLAGWLEKRMFARRASVRVLTAVTLFGRMLMLVCLANWCFAVPYPFQIPVWLAAGFGVLSTISWYFTELPLLRKLRARA
jgi:biotin transporter BioY